MKVRDYKMHGATPTGRSRSYTYYTTVRKVGMSHRSVPTGAVEGQIAFLLRGISVDPQALPKIRLLYRQHVAALKGPSLQERVIVLSERLDRLHVEEAALARLYAQGKLTDKNYDSLYREWQAKVFEVQQEVSRLQSSAEHVIDNLDEALQLLTYAPKLFDRLETLDQLRLLRILFRRIIIDTHGQIVEHELNPPFVYLTSLGGPPIGEGPQGPDFTGQNEVGSRQVQPAL